MIAESPAFMRGEYVKIKTILGENHNGYLKKFLSKCTELNPDNRYQSVEEIPPDIWQTWESDGENIYLPKNFSVSLNVENKDLKPLNLSMTADLKGLQQFEKIFPEINLAAGQSQNFEIPIGGMACNNGNFEIEIWLRKNDDTPLISFWNGENFSSKKTVKIYLIDYAKLKYR